NVASYGWADYDRRPPASRGGGRMNNNGGAYALQPGEGRPIDLGGFSMSVKASDDQAAGMFTLLEAAEPPDFGPPLHIHHGRGSVLRPRGRVRHLHRGDESRSPAGSFIFIPAETPHGF